MRSSGCMRAPSRPRTRLLMVSHMVNITGQILPVRKIADMAHARGVDVLVDGAHAFAHFDFRIPDLGRDYYAASLHKWLGCPLGTGILYVRRDKIPALWPIYGDWRMTDDTDIMKLNHTGTHPVHTDLAIEHAIAFHNLIGIGRKEARLRHLQNYWTSKVRQIPNVILNTPADPQRSCAIANVAVKGVPPADLSKILLDKYRIWTNAIDSDSAGVHGVRVTPHVFILPSELDVLVKGHRGDRANDQLTPGCQARSCRQESSDDTDIDVDCPGAQPGHDAATVAILPQTATVPDAAQAEAATKSLLSAFTGCDVAKMKEHFADQVQFVGDPQFLGEGRGPQVQRDLTRDQLMAAYTKMFSGMSCEQWTLLVKQSKATLTRATKDGTHVEDTTGIFHRRS